MLTLALLVLSQTPQHRLFQQPNLPRSSLAFFEAFPASGAGTTTACSTTAPTGARGEVLTFTRASNGTCTRTAAGGLATTGIANGDLVVLSSNVARVSYNSTGTLSLLSERTRTNLLFQFIAIDTAVTWTDIGTPTLTTGQTSPFAGALSTGAVQVDDNDGAAYEGRQQAVAVSAATAYVLSCYVKAGTRAEARITLDGTAAAITGLSATTWSIVSVADASSSGTSVVVELISGDATGDTGTVIFGGCQVEAGTSYSSIIPTTTIAVARAADVPTVNGSTWPTATYCVGATIETEWSATQNAGVIEGQVGSASGVGFFFLGGALAIRAQNLTAGADNTLDFASLPTAGVPVRFTTRNDGTNQSIYRNGALGAGPTAKTHADAPWDTATGIGYSPDGVGQLDGLISNVQVDSDIARCDR